MRKFIHNMAGIVLGAMIMAPAFAGTNPDELSINTLLLLLMLMVGVGFLFIGTKPNGQND